VVGLAHPQLAQALYRGAFRVGDCVNVSKAIKLQLGQQYVLVIHSMELLQLQQGSSCLLSSVSQSEDLEPLPLEGVTCVTDAPLLTPSVPFLCPWSLSAPLPLDQDRARSYLLAKLPPASAEQGHSLAELWSAWPGLSRTWPLSLRVLAVSRIRHKFSGGKHLCFANLLVADPSGACLVSLWDSAATQLLLGPCSTRLREGDLLVLGTSYKAA